MKRIATIVVAATLLTACATRSAPVDQDFVSFAEEGALKGTDVAWLVEDEDGSVVTAHRPDHLVHPASTLKLVTALAALDAKLGQRRFVTEIRGPAGPMPISPNISLPGPENCVVLVGGGDPLLSDKDLVSLAKRVPRESVRGFVWADASVHAGPSLGKGWMWDDEPAAFMPHRSGLMVDRGTVLVTVTGTEEKRPDVRLTPALFEPGDSSATCRVLNEAKNSLAADTGGQDLVITRKSESGREEILVLGSVPPGVQVSRRLSLRDPARAALDRFVFLLNDGVDVKDRALGLAVSRAPSEQILGPVLAEIVRPGPALLRPLLVDSDNLVAECLLREVSRWYGLPVGTTAAGLARLRDSLRDRGVPDGAHRIVDASGVSHYNLLTPRVLVTCLHALDGTIVDDDMARPGEGTLRGRLEGLEDRVRAKTGTVSGVSGLAGFVTTDSGRRLRFAILVQNFVGSARPWRRLQDAFVRRLAAR